MTAGECKGLHRNFSREIGIELHGAVAFRGTAQRMQDITFLRLPGLSPGSRDGDGIPYRSVTVDAVRRGAPRGASRVDSVCPSVSRSALPRLGAGAIGNATMNEAAMGGLLHGAPLNARHGAITAPRGPIRGIHRGMPPPALAPRTGTEPNRPATPSRAANHEPCAASYSAMASFRSSYSSQPNQHWSSSAARCTLAFSGRLSAR